MFALIFGFFFWNALGYFVIAAMESQLRGQAVPDEHQRRRHPAAALERQRDRLFLIPLITMRLFAEEKRTGTIELLVTSPITRHRS